MGNRCDHNPRKFRTCDIAKRGGKGSHHQVIQVLSANLQKVATSPGDRWRLKDLDTLNPSGRRMRTDGLEPILAVLQVNIVKWFQISSRGRCARPDIEHDILEVPTVKSLANQISNTPQWRGKIKISEDRVSSALQKLVKAGYIKRSAQARYKSESGAWVGLPSITSFTKKFFIHLCGGSHVYNLAKKASEEAQTRLKEREKVKRAKEGKITTSLDLIKLIRKHFHPGKIVTPKIAQAYRSGFFDKPPPSTI